MFLVKQFNYKFFYWLKKLPQSIINRLQLNLFIMFVCTPLLMFWGLPISLMGILGNIIFMPILTIFLLLSVVIFFLELFSLPNNFLIFILEKIVNIFTYALNISSSDWLINLQSSKIFFFLFISIFVFIILHLKSNKIVAISILCFSCIYFLAFCTTNLPDNIKYLSKNTVIINYNNNFALIDSGDLFKNSIVLNLRKEGIPKLDYLIILNPSTNILKSIINIINNFKIKYLLLPNWNGVMTNIGWGAWLDILRLTIKNNIKIVELETSQKIYLNKNVYFDVKVSQDNILKNKLEYKKVNYSQIKIEYLIDDKKILEVSN